MKTDERICQNCGAPWEQDSDQFGCWNCGQTTKPTQAMTDNSGKEELNIVAIMEQLFPPKPPTLTFLKSDWDEFREKVINEVKSLKAESDKLKEERDALVKEVEELTKLK